MMKDEIFALDIGTRKVMGIVASRTDDGIEVIDVEVIEHPTRAMFDGQIHSIDDVAKTVKKIKERLQSRTGRKLEQVGVAVAGRNLMTFKSNATSEFLVAEEITTEQVRDLELQAVDKIISESGRMLSDFYCVGYSPVYYEIDNSRISNPVGHNAKTLSTEVIATFLPRMVLDSIFSVLKKAKMEAVNITLEPISAINAIIPAEMRNLNIILVDIGAGTSDLALARDGLVFAYGMVPEAGDEITESISDNLLVDFSTAETIKRSINPKVDIEYEDIWSRKRKIDYPSLRAILVPCVKKLAEAIAKKGIELNGSAPQAVVAVGGGSLTPGLTEEIAASFGLPAYKAGIRLPSLIKGIKDNTGKLTGPEAVTPIGIALMTERSQGLRFIDVGVNSTSVKMLDFAQKKDVMGALTLSGFMNEKKLYPKPGLALTVKVNGDLRIVKGTIGKLARITLNGRLISSLSDKINTNDRLHIEAAIDGEDAKAYIKDIVELKPFCVTFNDEALQLTQLVTMDGVQVSVDAQVHDRAAIEVLNRTVKDLLSHKGIRLDELSERHILVNINSVPKILTQRNFTLIMNGKTCDLTTEVKDGDQIEFRPEAPTFYRVKDVVDFPTDIQKMHVSVDDKDIEVTIETVQVFMNGQRVNPEEFLIDGADIKVYRTKEKKILLSEIFKYVEVDPQKVLGKRIMIFVDDAPAGFTTPIVDGSKVRIAFEDRNAKA